SACQPATARGSATAELRGPRLRLTAELDAESGPRARSAWPLRGSRVDASASGSARDTHKAQVAEPQKTPTRVRILDIAEQEFATRGYRGASLSEIASGVGIRTPSLCKHFASKQALYDAVLDRLLEPFVTALTDLIQPPQNAEDAQRNVVAVFR